MRHANCFGMFIEIGDAVHGFLPGAALTVGDRVRVELVDIDADKHADKNRVSLAET